MSQVVMLTGLAGPDVDIQAGDICECASDQARRFVAFGYARPAGKADEKRKVKRLPEASGERRQPTNRPTQQDANVRRRKTRGKANQGKAAATGGATPAQE